jgi:hypothetical protein
MPGRSARLDEDSPSVEEGEVGALIRPIITPAPNAKTAAPVLKIHGDFIGVIRAWKTLRIPRFFRERGV